MRFFLTGGAVLTHTPYLVAVMLTCRVTTYGAVFGRLVKCVRVINARACRCVFPPRVSPGSVELDCIVGKDSWTRVIGPQLASSTLGGHGSGVCPGSGRRGAGEPRG